MAEHEQRDRQETLENTPMTDIGRGSPPNTPRWVKVFGLIALLLLLLVVILHLTGNSFGGPMSHGIHLP